MPFARPVALVFGFCVGNLETMKSVVLLNKKLCFEGSGRCWLDIFWKCSSHFGWLEGDCELLAAERCYCTLWNCKMHPLRCTLGARIWRIGGFVGSRSMVDGKQLYLAEAVGVALIEFYSKYNPWVNVGSRLC